MQVFAAVAFGVGLGFTEGYEKASEFFAGYATFLKFSRMGDLIVSSQIAVLVLFDSCSRSYLVGKKKKLAFLLNAKYFNFIIQLYTARIEQSMF